MKEEKENQKIKEEKIDLKETKENKTDTKESKAKKADEKKTTVKKKATTKKTTTKKTTAKKTTVKKTTESKKADAKLDDEETKETDSKLEKEETKETDSKLAKEETKKVDSKEEQAEVKQKAAKSTKKSDSEEIPEENAEEKTTIKMEPEEVEKGEISVKQKKKTKENNAKLEASIAKLKGKKKKEKEEISNEDTSTVEKFDDKEEIIINEPEESEESKKRKEQLEKEEELLEKKKRRKNTIITVSIVSALIVIIIIVSIIISNLNSTKTESHNFFQWYSGQKVEYKGELTFTRKEGLTELKATDKKVTLDSTPVYYAEKENKVIFPEDMAIVFPHNNGMMYRINHFSNIIEENSDVYLETNLAVETNKTKLDQAFLYDGQDLYFFLERTNITVNGTTYEVSPLSYAIVRYKQSIEIYNYEKDEYQVIDIQDGQEAKVVTDTYTINMSFDSLQTAEKEQLLIRGLSYLQPYTENGI